MKGGLLISISRQVKRSTHVLKVWFEKCMWPSFQSIDWGGERLLLEIGAGRTQTSPALDHKALSLEQRG